jgi:hypothetical protein
VHGHRQHPITASLSFVHIPRGCRGEAGCDNGERMILLLCTSAGQGRRFTRSVHRVGVGFGAG